MGEKRARINLSVDPATLGLLETPRMRTGFNTLPKLVMAIIRIHLRLQANGNEKWDNLPEDEEQWLRKMFSELADAECQKPGYYRAGPFNEYTK